MAFTSNIIIAANSRSWSGICVKKLPSNRVLAAAGRGMLLQKQAPRSNSVLKNNKNLFFVFILWFGLYSFFSQGLGREGVGCFYCLHGCYFGRWIHEAGWPCKVHFSICAESAIGFKHPAIPFLMEE